MSFVEGNASLNSFIYSDKLTCLGELENATDNELWDSYLEGQAKLFFDSEYHWLSTQYWWQKATNILEIGSGNGAFLYNLSNYYPHKIFTGIELLSHTVCQQINNILKTI